MAKKDTPPPKKKKKKKKKKTHHRTDIEADLWPERSYPQKWLYPRTQSSRITAACSEKDNDYRTGNLHETGTLNCEVYLFKNILLYFHLILFIQICFRVIYMYLWHMCMEVKHLVHILPVTLKTHSPSGVWTDLEQYLTIKTKIYKISNFEFNYAEYCH